MCSEEPKKLHGDRLSFVEGEKVAAIQQDQLRSGEESKHSTGEGFRYYRIPGAMKYQCGSA